MADEQMGLFRAFWRLVTFYGLRKQLGLVSLLWSDCWDVRTFCCADP